MTCPGVQSWLVAEVWWSVAKGELQVVMRTSKERHVESAAWRRAVTSVEELASLRQLHREGLGTKAPCLCFFCPLTPSRAPLGQYSREPGGVEIPVEKGSVSQPTGTQPLSDWRRPFFPKLLLLLWLYGSTRVSWELRRWALICSLFLTRFRSCPHGF